MLGSGRGRRGRLSVEVLVLAMLEGVAVASGEFLASGSQEDGTEVS